MSRVTCPLDSPCFTILKTLQRATKFAARKTPMFLRNNRTTEIETFLVSVTRWTSCSLVTRMFSHPERSAKYNVSYLSHSVMHGATEVTKANGRLFGVVHKFGEVEL